MKLSFAIGGPFAVALLSFCAFTAPALAAPIKVKPNVDLGLTTSNIQTDGDWLYKPAEGAEPYQFVLKRIDPLRKREQTVVSFSSTDKIGGEQIGQIQSFNVRNGVIALTTRTFSPDPANPPLLHDDSKLIGLNADGSNMRILARATQLAGADWFSTKCGSRIDQADPVAGGAFMVVIKNGPTDASGALPCPAIEGPPLGQAIKRVGPTGDSKLLATRPPELLEDRIFSRYLVFSPDGERFVAAFYRGLKFTDARTTNPVYVGTMRGSSLDALDIDAAGRVLINEHRNVHDVTRSRLVLYRKFASRASRKVLYNGVRGWMDAKFCGSKIALVDQRAQMLVIFNRDGRRIQSFNGKTKWSWWLGFTCSNTRLLWTDEFSNTKEFLLKLR